MGSFFAGIKAGTLSGVLYVGGLAIFNVVVLLTLKQDALGAIKINYSQSCIVGSSINSTSTLNDCYSLLLSVYVPFVAFIAFFITLFYAGIFGYLYESFPTKRPVFKGESVALVVCANLLFFGYSGFYFDLASDVATLSFLLAWTIVFGYVIGKLYKRYTRVVSFHDETEGRSKIVVDGKDLTGKSRTFAAGSTHNLRAEVSSPGSFKGWGVTGGIKLEDDLSFETSMEVTEDGSLTVKASWN